jgi:hypothetical protein
MLHDVYFRALPIVGRGSQWFEEGDVTVKVVDDERGAHRVFQGIGEEC